MTSNIAKQCPREAILLAYFNGYLLGPYDDDLRVSTPTDLKDDEKASSLQLYS